MVLSLLSRGDADALLEAEDNGKDEDCNIKFSVCVFVGVLFKKLDAQPLIFEVEGKVEDVGNISAHFIFWALKFSPLPCCFAWVLPIPPINEESAAAKADWKVGFVVIAFVAADIVSTELLLFCM